MSNVTIHMGANKFTADVKTPNGPVHFDLNKLTKAEQHQFRRELTKAWREANS